MSKTPLEIEEFLESVRGFGKTIADAKPKPAPTAKLTGEGMPLYAAVTIAVLATVGFVALEHVNRRKTWVEKSSSNASTSRSRD